MTCELKLYKNSMDPDLFNPAYAIASADEHSIIH